MKNILITGHSKGIGKLLTDGFLQKGFYVTGIARTKITEHNNLIQLSYDLSIADDIAEACRKIEIQRFDIVILNAGYNDIKPPESYSIDEIIGIYNVNLTAQAALLRACIPGLINNKGWIFGIGSYSGISVSRWNNFYGSAKAGLQHLLQNIFEQYRKQGIRVTTVIPDIVNTTFYNHQQFIPEQDESTFIKPEEIAEMIINIVSNPPDYVPLEMVIRPQKFGLKRK
ncbi:MAG: SDR family oxidoreductase [Bacteroidia bacterium]